MKTELPARHPAAPGYLRAESAQKLIHRLRRIEGQVRGIQNMVEEGRYCVEIMTQIDAAAAALARVQDGILESHLQHCVADALEGRDVGARRQKVDEVVTLLKKYRRSAK
jgi:DNA-binding FrmR family transcriptional regulator